MRCQLKVVPHAQQRYNTVGDWYYNKEGMMIITSSALGNGDYEFLIQLHELIEAKLCLEHGVTEQQVDDFDKWFEEQGLVGEPGDHPESPYLLEHSIATQHEHEMAKALGVDWNLYEQRIEEVFNGAIYEGATHVNETAATKQLRED
jgi:hypothetical protein